MKILTLWSKTCAKDWKSQDPWVVNEVISFLQKVRFSKPETIKIPKN